MSSDGTICGGTTTCSESGEMDLVAWSFGAVLSVEIFFWESHGASVCVCLLTQQSGRCSVFG